MKKIAYSKHQTIIPAIIYIIICSGFIIVPVLEWINLFLEKRYIETMIFGIWVIIIVYVMIRLIIICVRITKNRIKLNKIMPENYIDYDNKRKELILNNDTVIPIDSVKAIYTGNTYNYSFKYLGINFVNEDMNTLIIKLKNKKEYSLYALKELEKTAEELRKICDIK